MNEWLDQSGERASERAGGREWRQAECLSAAQTDGPSRQLQNERLESHNWPTRVQTRPAIEGVIDLVLVRASI